MRRELAVHFTHLTSKDDAFADLPQWAQKSLRQHQKDRRQHICTCRQPESAVTHDPYRIAAMCEMKATGFMHNYMRMYWAQRIIEWSRTPSHAFWTT